MNKILSIFIFYLIFGSINYIYSQNLTNIKDCLVVVNYSDEAEKLKNLLFDDAQIKNLIKLEILELNIKSELELSELFDNKYFAILSVNYDIFKNYEDNNSNQYYGAVSLEVVRYLMDMDIDTSNYIKSEVFSKQSYFVLNNPVNEGIKNEFSQIIYNMISAVSAEYHKDN